MKSEIMMHNKHIVNTDIIKGGIIIMRNTKPNNSIRCTVQQCMHHCGEQSFCSLDQVSIGTHEMNPTMDQCTDCKSFQL
ncbi:DUF1540 domain-containing protein [Clostridia bacterium OttesenSCG-928-F22]|nr:DUF1540 domain-containing protein [Clostridia bacterium OttesenSCG-928-F22]